MSISEKYICKSLDNKPIYGFSIKNSLGAEVRLLNYSATLTHLFMPDKNGKLEDLVLGFDNEEHYLGSHPNFGVTVGRFANRIKHGEFWLNNQKYNLTVNHGKHHLHGGFNGLAQKVWHAEPVKTNTQTGIKFSYSSPNGEEGYPGNLDVWVTYWLNNNDNTLTIYHNAKTDAPTPINLTHHSYFNLDGQHADSIKEHELQINAEMVVEVDDELIPTGKFVTVKNSFLDFRSPISIGENMNKSANGFDHCFVLLEQMYNNKQFNACVYSPISKRKMEVYTNQPGMQFYVPSNFSPQITGKGGIKYNGANSLCLETQAFPDSPNHNNFPNTILNPENQYDHYVSYVFKT